MDDIREIIQTLDDDNKKEFRHFLNRIRQKGKRRDEELFNILQDEKELKPKQIILKLYGSDNKEAYYALRKRLNKQIVEFLILKSRENDPTDISSVLEFINVSQYLYDNKKDRLAAKYLNRARIIAEEIEHYELLNGIYNLIIDKQEWQEEEDLKEFIKRHAKNKLKLDQDERINFANSIIRQKLLSHQKQSKTIDFNNLTTDVFSEFGLSQNILSNPRVVYKLISLSRNAIIAKKDFYAFEPFIIKRYNNLLRKDSFTPKSVYYQMGLLYYIAHTLYRNKKFDEAKVYLEKLKDCLEGDGNSYYSFYYPKFMLLDAGLSVFKEDLVRAHACLDELLENKRIHLEHADRLNILVNKGIYFFLDGDFKSTNQILNSIYHTDKWCEKHLGKEWVLKKNLMEVILFFEMDKMDLAESRLRSIERTYKDFFKHPLYKRVKRFLSLIKHVALNPSDVNSHEFQKMVDDKIDWQPFGQEDLQAMGFYAWLKSKMLNRDVYEVWLDLSKGHK